MPMITRANWGRAHDLYWGHSLAISRENPKMLRNSIRNLNDFIGCIPLYHKGLKSHEVTEKAESRIRMLFSPHVRTLLKMHFIQRGVL